MVSAPELVYHIIWFSVLTGLSIFVIRVLMRRY